jgi:serine/threonine protein kinase/DNA-binding beta-propeller fold protein YncE
MEGLQRGDPASVGGYQLLGRLGTGGMGRVFLGVSPSGRRVAVKLIHPFYAGTEQFRERFAREVAAARRVGGFHTAPVIDADPHAETPWMVTAYIEGPSLHQATVRHGPLPPGRVRALGAGLAEGLGAIHAHGLVHRDLKPGNVIMAEDGPRIIDFGIARSIDATTLTSAGAMVGTFAYMSPEQVRGEPVRPVSDVFSLGSVLAFAATGRPPFGSDTAATVMFRIVSEPPDLDGLADQDLRTLIEACLAKSPQDRPQVPVVLAALTGRAPLPAATPRASAVDGRDPLDPLNPLVRPSRVPPATPDPSRTDPSRTDPPRADPPGQPARARPASRRPSRRPGRRRVALIAALAVIAVLAAVIPILVTSGSPGHAGGTAEPTLGSTIPERYPVITPPGNVQPYAVALSPDGRLLAVGGEFSGPAYLYDVATGKLAATLKVRGSGQITDVAFRPDGKLLASTNGSQIFLWNVPAGTLAATLANAGGSGLAFSPDGKLLASGDGSDVDVRHVASDQMTFTSAVVASAVNAVTFSPDGKLLAAAAAPAFLWDVATGQRIAALYDPGGYGDDDVAFSPDGQLLAVADHKGITYLWNVATHGLVATLPDSGPNSQENLVAFSPDGKLLATANGDLWNVATRKLAGTIAGPDGWHFASVAFSADGRLVAAADWNGPIFIRVLSQLVS